MERAFAAAGARGAAAARRPRGQARGPPARRSCCSPPSPTTAPQVRAEAALALGDGGFLEAVRPLMDLKASDPSAEVRQAAAMALTQADAPVASGVFQPIGPRRRALRGGVPPPARPHPRAVRPLLRRQPARARCARAWPAGWPPSTSCPSRTTTTTCASAPSAPRSCSAWSPTSPTTRPTSTARRRSSRSSRTTVLRGHQGRARRRDGDRTLRVLSAGCSTGEEAYTLAMIIYDSGQFFWNWDVAGDRHGRGPGRAGEGARGPSTIHNSFRSVSPAVKERHFVPPGRGGPGEGRRSAAW